MRQIYWLYYGHTIVASVMHKEGVTETEAGIKEEALRWHDAVPCCSALFPAHAPFEIRLMIQYADIRL